jgi:FADH2 O2-dependent halogenase
MTERRVDVVVVGSGFSGSITALLLNRIGLSVLLLDRSQHPRFAIGESSTPAADFVLADLAREYSLPRLMPLTQFGSLRSTYPKLGCGLKRGFSYFQHATGRPFVPDPDRSNELLVAASSDDVSSDSHWYRSDIDKFLVDEVRANGIEVCESVNVGVSRHEPTWKLSVGPSNPNCKPGRSFDVHCDFLIDASGGGRFLADQLRIPDRSNELLTRTQSVYGHFSNVIRFRSVLETHGFETEHHPFDCDHSATHHLFDDGWMWVLRFENGITSAGIVKRCTQSASKPGSEVWSDTLSEFPSLKESFETASLHTPDELVTTGRMQRLASRIAGPNWAMLPSAAGFVDPLHSTGIAHSMVGIERLLSILQKHWGRESLPGELDSYATIVDSELRMIDLLVAACYASLGQFQKFVACTMLYFAAISTWEATRRRNGPACDSAFLLADDAEFIRRCETLRSQVDCVESADQFTELVRRTIEPWNAVGLLDPAARNMYYHTAAR